MSSTTEQTTRPDFTTRLCLETPTPHNPYVTEHRYIAGYHVADLWRGRSYCDVLLLLFLGELPTPAQTRFAETLLIGLLNPGPRHPAVRAAMLAGVSKTAPEHLLSIGLLTGSGAQGGALEVEAAHAFIAGHLDRDPQHTAAKCRSEQLPTPGFGAEFGEPEPIWQQLVADLTGILPESRVMQWSEQFALALTPSRQGWLLPGVAAAAGLALGLGPRETLALFQLAIAPGVIAHGMEQTHNPISNNPLLRDNQYECVE